MGSLVAVYRRELTAYFQTPLAYVFLAVFAFAAPAFAFHIGRFFDTNRADLAPLFDYLPWLLVILMPALARPRPCACWPVVLNPIPGLPASPAMTASRTGSRRNRGSVICPRVHQPIRR